MAQKQAKQEVAPREEPNGQPPVSMAPILGPSDAMTQATRIEGARAIAEVQAAVLVAQANHRDETAAERNMLRACQHREMADVAFYRYPRGGEVITGITVQLARELLRCWGNAQSGIVELQRLPGRSEMQAWAWDLETNVRMSTTFWWNHTRDARGQTVELTTDRDVYEGNANAGARRERAMIERILPAWFVTKAKTECYRTLQGDPAQHEARVKDALGKFKGKYNLTRADLERKVGAPVSIWGPVDLATLTVVWGSLERGEVTLDEEFPDRSRQGSAADTLAQAAAAQAKTEPTSPATPADPPEDPQGSLSPPPPPGERDKAEALTQIGAAFKEAGWGGNSAEARRVRLAVVAAWAREDQQVDPLVEVTKADDLDDGQAGRLADRLGRALADTGQDPHERLAKVARNVQDAKAKAAPGGEQ